MLSGLRSRYRFSLQRLTGAQGQQVVLEWQKHAIPPRPLGSTPTSLNVLAVRIAL